MANNNDSMLYISGSVALRKKMSLSIKRLISDLKTIALHRTANFALPQRILQTGVRWKIALSFYVEVAFP